MNEELKQGIETFVANLSKGDRFHYNINEYMYLGNDSKGLIKAVKMNADIDDEDILEWIDEIELIEDMCKVEAELNKVGL